MRGKPISFNILYCLSIIFFVFLGVFFINHQAMALSPTKVVDVIPADIWLEPNEPQIGKKVNVVARIYNNGIYETKYQISTITVSFLVDNKLLTKTSIENIKPGEPNSVIISSGNLWTVTEGEHTLSVLLEYKAQKDQKDDTSNNRIDKNITIKSSKSTQLSLKINPSYLLQNTANVVTVNGSLLDKTSKSPLAAQTITLETADSKISLITDENGVFSLTKAIMPTQNRILVKAYYEGNFPYSNSNVSKIVHVIPVSKNNGVVILKMVDPTSKYNFINMPTRVVVFQDSYKNKYAEIDVNKKGILNNNTAWIDLEGDHSYSQAIYVKDRHLFSTNWKNVSKNEIIETTLTFPKPAEIRFHVKDSYENPLNGAIVKNWIYSAKTDKNGFTDWIKILPTEYKSEPYEAKITTNEGKTFKSSPFYVESQKKETIEILSTLNDTKILPKLLNNTYSCNCVAFRLDDIQDFYLNAIQKEVISTFQKENASLTIGIIGNSFGEDTKLVSFIRQQLKNNSNSDVTLEIANHGWNHEDFTNFSKDKQSLLIANTNKKISDMLGVTSKGFIAPYNSINDDTLIALNENKMKYVSANTKNDDPPYDLKNQTLYHFPTTAATAMTDENQTSEWERMNHKETYASILDSLLNYGFAVVMMHPMDFAMQDELTFQNDIDWNQLHELELLLDMIKQEGLEIVPIIGIPEFDTVYQKSPTWVKNIFVLYEEQQISEDEVLNAIKFLKEKNILI